MHAPVDMYSTCVLHKLFCISLSACDKKIIMAVLLYHRRFGKSIYIPPFCKEYVLLDTY